MVHACSSVLTHRYQSTELGCYQNLELIETFINYQESIKRAICIVFDPPRAAQGGLGLTAVRLSDAYVEQHRAGSLTYEKLKVLAGF